jgi:hypothetical protein
MLIPGYRRAVMAAVDDVIQSMIGKPKKKKTPVERPADKKDTRATNQLIGGRTLIRVVRPPE